MDEPIELSFVIPVFNGAGTVGDVVDRIHEVFADLALEVVLVNDGSSDASESACLALAQRHPETVSFVQLTRNFGEHNAVMAGLHHSRGRYVAVLDDDGQNPPEEVRRLHDEIRRGSHDVVYGHYREKRHGRLRNLGSWFNDRVANWMLGKPRSLYLSSFKILNRFVVDQITGYRGAFPYIDGLILRVTRNLAQVEVEHRERREARSSYTTRKLVRLWLNMSLNSSIAPLRLASLLGLAAAGLSLPLLVLIVIDKLYFNPELTLGLPTLLLTVVFFAGVQLLILGTIGEYLGRLFLDHAGHPQFVVRYARGAHRAESGALPLATVGRRGSGAPG